MVSKIRLFNAEALEWLKENNGNYDLIFMDPPDNIGLNYGSEINDNRLKTDYYNWLRSIILESMNHSGVIWVSYYWRHMIEVNYIVRNLIRGRDWEARTFIWNFNFGQYRETDCTNCYRPILRLSRVGTKWHFPESIRVVSERTRLGDPRARGLKVPGDVWHIPRIQGNNKERRSWCPTQHPEALLKRIILMSTSIYNRKILELFTGSGSMIRVAKQLCFDLDTVELNSDYCKQLTKEHPSID